VPPAGKKLATPRETDRANRKKANGAVRDGPASRTNATGARDKATGAGRSTHQFAGLSRGGNRRLTAV